MEKIRITSDELPAPNGHFSQAVLASPGKLLFISGMTSRGKDGVVQGIGDVEVQADQVYRNLRSAVEAAGGTMDDICRIDVYVRNIEDFSIVHEVRARHFTGVTPASTMVEVSKFVNKDYLIEINAIAVL